MTDITADAENTDTISPDLLGILMRLLPRQTSLLVASGSITKPQINILLTLAINLTHNSADVDVLVAAMLKYQ